MLLAGMLVLLIAGCGSIGGGDSPTAVPTATVWPTVNDAAEASSPQASPPWQMNEPTSASSPVVATTEAPASPAASLPVEDRSSPASVVELETVPATAVSTAAAPVATPEAPAVATPQPVTATEPTTATTANPSSASVEQQANPETGDGTSGAPAVSDLPARTPSSASPATPIANPVASPGAAVIVTSCTPTDVPAFTGSSASFITTADVNIRVGPGTDCDLAADILSQGTLLTVTSGQVIRDGQPGTTWVRVDVDGLEGWVSTEFLEPDGE